MRLLYRLLPVGEDIVSGAIADKSNSLIDEIISMNILKMLTVVFVSYQKAFGSTSKILTGT